MIWIMVVILAALALAPLAWVLLHDGAARGRKEAALSLHRAQLAELDRDLAEARIGPEDHHIARAEVGRRLLAEDRAPETIAQGGRRGGIIATLVVVPVLAFGLYLLGGTPSMPSAPIAARQAAEVAQRTQEVALEQALRQRLAALPPGAPQARQGLILLGGLAAEQAHWADAATAWGQALALEYSPSLAAQTAEAQSRAAGHVTAPAAALFRRALADGPPDAPWRNLAQQRLAEQDPGTPP